MEYFTLKDQFIAAIVTREDLEIVPLTPVSRVVNLLRLFHFQISKFKLGADYTQTFEQSMLESVQAHLRQLYDEVLATAARSFARAKTPRDRAAWRAALSSLSRACSTERLHH